MLTQLTNHDAAAVGIVMGLQFAPQLLLLPWTGLAADRFNQRKLLMLTQVTMGVLALILGVLTIEGVTRLWHVYMFAFLFGSAAALGRFARRWSGQTPIVGWVANHFGPRWALGVGAASGFAAAIVAVRAVSGQRTCTDGRSSDVAAREGVK